MAKKNESKPADLEAFLKDNPKATWDEIMEFVNGQKK